MPWTEQPRNTTWYDPKKPNGGLTDTPRRVDGGRAVLGVASFFVPGLGQLIDGRVGTGVIHFVLAAFLWMMMLGWLVHLYSAYDAAKN